MKQKTKAQRLCEMRFRLPIASWSSVPRVCPSPATGMDNDRRCDRKGDLMNRGPGARRSICNRHSLSPNKCAACMPSVRGCGVHRARAGSRNEACPCRLRSGLRVIPVRRGAIDNVGFTRIGLRRSPVGSRSLGRLRFARNYGSAPRSSSSGCSVRRRADREQGR